MSLLPMTSDKFVLFIEQVASPQLGGRLLRGHERKIDVAGIHPGFERSHVEIADGEVKFRRTLAALADK